VAEPAAVVPDDPLPEELPLLDPQAVNPMARHRASGHARSLMLRPVACPIVSLLSGLGSAARPPCHGRRDGTDPVFRRVVGGTPDPTG
jgi:hypothetical protein